MVLWVRSQDKEAITVCEKLCIEQFYDKKTEIEATEAYMSAMNKAYNFGSTKNAEKEAQARSKNVYSRAKTHYSINNDEYRLGIYSSKERAIQILNEIHNILDAKSLLVVYQMPES